MGSLITHNAGFSPVEPFSMMSESLPQDELLHLDQKLWSQLACETLFDSSVYSEDTNTSSATSPSPSSEGSPQDNTVVSVSTAFFPGAHAIDPDVLFSSSDSVLFYAHSDIITGTAPNAFHRFLKAPLTDKNLRNHIISVPDSSSVFNIILHLLYGTPSAQHSPSLDDLKTAVDRMPLYGIVPKDHIVPMTPLHQLLLSHAPLFPIEIYALAGHHDLKTIAIATSSHLLSYPLSNITDDIAERIGAVYLKRLLSLHVNRFNSLKQILLIPPHPHPETKDCTFEEQKKLTRAWALVSAYLAWDARIDISTNSMQSVLNPLIEHLTCQSCHQALKNRIRDVTVQWASVKRTV